MTFFQFIRACLVDIGIDKIYITDEDYDTLKVSRWSEDFSGDEVDVTFHTDKHICRATDYDGKSQFEIHEKKTPPELLPYSL